MRNEAGGRTVGGLTNWVVPRLLSADSNSISHLTCSLYVLTESTETSGRSVDFVGRISQFLEKLRCSGKVGVAAMRQIVTSDQFVAAVISILALQDRRHFVLTETLLDDRFQRAFEDLVAREEEFAITPNFSFRVDPLHGDSVCLRDTLLAAKEKELIALNNPTFRTFEIKINKERAQKYLKKIPIPLNFLEDIVRKHFSDLVDHAVVGRV